ncbi:hypothetical protein NKH45_25260 [Mesorhizobium sp. M1156]|uniref:hypothetical protein n=1 Tax=Mesorhizobium sp. M1156 TaxID=2957064 RepID=UPI0033369979
MLLIDKSPSANKLAPCAIARPSNAFTAFAGNFTVEIFKMKFADTATQVLLGNYNANSPFFQQSLLAAAIYQRHRVVVFWVSERLRHHDDHLHTLASI